MDTSPEATRRQSLDQLRRIKEGLFQPQINDGIRALEPKQRQEFVNRRLQLTEAILRLETAQLSEIRQAIEDHSEDLSGDVLELAEALADRTQAARWSAGLGRLLSIIAKIVPVL